MVLLPSSTFMYAHNREGKFTSIVTLSSVHVTFQLGLRVRFPSTLTRPLLVQGNVLQIIAPPLGPSTVDLKMASPSMTTSLQILMQSLVLGTKSGIPSFSLMDRLVKTTRTLTSVGLMWALLVLMKLARRLSTLLSSRPWIKVWGLGLWWRSTSRHHF